MEKKGQADAGATVQTEVMELTAAEVDKFKTESFEAGANAERTRITGILAVAGELNIDSSSATVQRMIAGGHNLEMSRGLLTDMKAELDSMSSVNSQHDAGADKQEKKVAINTAGIYAKRNARKGGA